MAIPKDSRRGYAAASFQGCPDSLEQVPGFNRNGCPDSVGIRISDHALAELERLAERPAVADLLSRARARAGGVEPGAVVAAVRAGRDRS